MVNDKSFNELLKQYDYQLPHELIAQEPAEPRDSARLLVCNRQADVISFDTFANLPTYLPKNSLLVFNQTKVLPARLYATRETGGKVEIFYVKTVDDTIEVMSNRLLKIGEILYCSSASREQASPNKPTADSRLRSNDIQFTVVRQNEKYFHLRPSFPSREVFSILEKFGVTPIPPYIKESQLSENELRNKYQTVFAKEKGSVAAPTASLHFTEELMQKIKNAGHAICFVTLHVNLGTFAPLTEEHVKEQKLHEEWYEIPKATAEAIQQAKDQGRPIIAVGTTVVRTLESAAVTGQISGTTDLFISEGYEFRTVNGMITNFHVPKSSLLMLVAALIGREKLFELYQKAIEEKFRFFSFGDGMLIW